MPEKSARHNLNQAVYALRKVFPDLKDFHGDPVPHLLTNRNTIQLNPAANAEVDIHQMDDLLESTQAHAHQDLPGCAT
jgi:DNA-binding SARP family transcriptional activator